MAYRNLDNRLIMLIGSLCKTNNRKYVTVSIPTLRQMLDEDGSGTPSCSTIRRTLTELVEKDLIIRKQRKKKVSTGQWVSLPNLYHFTKNGWKYLKSLLKRLLRICGLAGSSKPDSQNSNYKKSTPKKRRDSKNRRPLFGKETLFLPGSGTIRPSSAFA